ncbi:MarR family transcriptional regulator [Mogibacterium neglectum]|uniref:MarR family winged helix-turn-helix transcriptional regulator n=1 Tax=Mogibacterium neglectum TaxID=114528 RepID=UPI002ED53879
MDKYDSLKLENQLCFPLYACSKEITRRYKPFLSKLDLTYTQYITMMVLWEARELSVKELGDKLFLDSGTLTPLLKKLEAKGYLTRNRSVKDERNLIIKITDKGMALREEALAVPQEIRSCISLTDDETAALFKLLHNFMSTIEQ